MIAIIDYEAGNLDSVYKALRSLGQDAVVTSSPPAVRKASRVILPGVGNFEAGIRMLRKKKLDALITREINRGKLFLGICLGMQLLFSKSEEAPGETGLALFPGAVKRFSLRKLIVPHMGWNTVRWETGRNPVGILNGIGNDCYFYFAHSYYCPSGNFSSGVTSYGIRFTSFLQQDNIVAVQFHPEKSQAIGLRFLRNFCTLKA